MAEVICPFCRNTVPSGHVACPNCFGSVLKAATRSSPLPDAVCPRCGSETAAPDASVCARCSQPLDRPARDPLGLGRPPTGPRILVLEFATGRVTVEPGATAVLGREPEFSPHARVFVHHDNVSRRHATIGVERNGQAWVRDERSTNGTFVNGESAPPGDRRLLSDGDTLRLAADVEAIVHLLGDQDIPY